MKKCFYLFDSYTKGLFCLAVICVLPAMSPLISFNLGQTNSVPFIMVLIANIGIFYEFFPWNKKEDAVRRVKLERMLIECSAIFFGCYAMYFIILFSTIGGQSVTWANYLLLSYVAVPIFVTIFEIIFICKDEYRNDGGSDSDVIAKGTATEV